MSAIKSADTDQNESLKGGSLMSILTAVQWDYLLRLGLGAARRQGVSHCDQEDCALEFAYSMACRAVSFPPVAWSNPAYFYRCATNYARHFKMCILRTYSHQSVEGPEDDEKGNCLEIGCAATQPCLSAFRLNGTIPSLEIVMARERMQRIKTCLDALTPGQRVAFERCALNGEAAADVARETGTSTTAVCSALARARRSLQAMLDRQGYSLGIPCRRTKKVPSPKK